jgi:oligopeptide/dipeptide ABC transporter ATP-binding protein
VVASREALFTTPAHPYTQALLSAAPIPDPTRRRTRTLITGETPSPIAPPSGCRFHTRCPMAEAICGEVEPDLLEIAPGHAVACHFRTAAAVS